VKTKIKARAKMMAERLNAASVKSGIILKRGCKNAKTHAVARTLPENAKPNCLKTRGKPEKCFLPSILMISLHLSACRV